MKRGFMASAAVLILLLSNASFPQNGQHDGFGGIRLLEGFDFQKEHAVDAVTWKIVKRGGGLTINFEAGPNEGWQTRVAGREKCAWYREQIVNGHRILLALTKPKTWKSPDEGGALLVVFPLPGANDPDNAAVFQANVQNSKDVADALLMILTFNPDKMP